MPQYTYQEFKTVTPPELGGDGIAKSPYPVAIIGAGPIGLAAAIDLATRGVSNVVLDDNNVVSIGSRAICWSKRTLEILDRLGVGERMLEKGVTWKTGRLFHGEDEVYNFDLLPEEGHKYPAFINLQQYYVEQYLVERALQFPDLIDLRFKNRVTNHADLGDHMRLNIETPKGNYDLTADYVLACDGAGSPTRKREGLAFDGQTFDEHFLIADVEMDESPFATEEAERWFWFKPPFHPGQSALLHKQPDNIYRIDLQLDPDSDPKAEATKERVLPRIKQIVGNKPFKLDWMSVYKFRCARLERFVHNRLIFVGDSAHVVSPFGARGGNGGIQDVDNLCWKLAMVLNGHAEEELLESYDQERLHACEENILNSSRATNFMTPKSPIEHLFRDQVLSLAKTMPFARKLINSGRLSTPASLEGMPLQSNTRRSRLVGSALIDAPLQKDGNSTWLVTEIPTGFCLLAIGSHELPEIEGTKKMIIGRGKAADFEDTHGMAEARYGKNTCYLVRPDGHICADLTGATKTEIMAALDRAIGRQPTQEAA